MIFWLNRLQSFKNSFIDDRLLRNFLTRSKKAISSCVDVDDDFGAYGSGISGVNVGSIVEGSPVALALLNFGRLLPFNPVGGLRDATTAASRIDVPVGPCLSVLGRFLSLLALAGGAKLPRGGIFWPSLIPG